MHATFVECQGADDSADSEDHSTGRQAYLKPPHAGIPTTKDHQEADKNHNLGRDTHSNPLQGRKQETTDHRAAHIGDDNLQPFLELLGDSPNTQDKHLGIHPNNHNGKGDQSGFHGPHGKSTVRKSGTDIHEKNGPNTKAGRSQHDNQGKNANEKESGGYSHTKNNKHPKAGDGTTK